MIDLIRSSAVPATLVQAAARGALSVPPPEMIEILVHLAIHNKVFSQQARLTLAGWDESASQQTVGDPGTPKEVLEYFAAADNLRPALLPTLLENPSVSDELLTVLAASGPLEAVEAMTKSPRVKSSAALLNALRSNPNSKGETIPAAVEEPPAPAVLPASNEDSDPAVDEGLTAYLDEHAQEISREGEKPFQPMGGSYEGMFTGTGEEPAAAAPESAPEETASPSVAAAKKANAPKKSHLAAEEERGSALQKINKLDIKGRIQLAMKGTKEERSLLVRDGTKVVALAVLESPKISDAEVEKFASQKNVLEAVLRQIPLKRRFMKHYGIVRNLVFNPRTPLDISLGLMKNLLVGDLRNLSGNKEVSETVRKLALKMFKQKTDTTKRSSD